MAVKGYIVRGKNYREVTVWAEREYEDGEVETAALRAEATLFTTLALAAAAYCEMASGFNTDVRISAVAEDGSETPLPSYEEALTRLARASSYEFGPPDRSIEMVRADGGKWQIQRKHGRDTSAWDGEAWEYRGRLTWTFEDAWAQCERIVREGVWPIGEVRPWLDRADREP